MIKAVLFDLDGTLLPMDQEEFTKGYLGLLSKKMAEYGYQPESLVKAVWTGVSSMVKNDGSTTNEEVFWKAFDQLFDKDARKDEPLFQAFYENEFDQAKACCGYDENARKLIDTVKEKGFRAVLATNPIFPAIATGKRIQWAGLCPEDFEFYTTYENSRFCKPNPKYYQEILNQMGLSPEECVMVGNDVTEDMVAETLGMKVFLLTDCMINKEDKDISAYPHGGFPEAIAYINSL